MELQQNHSLRFWKLLANFPLLPEGMQTQNKMKADPLLLLQGILHQGVLVGKHVFEFACKLLQGISIVRLEREF